MAKSFLLIALRNLFKHKIFSFINSFGLAIGIAAGAAGIGTCILALLTRYAFRITLTPWLFIGPILLILVVALLTITTQTLKAATASPVKNLRTE